jgi:hypothetical protein
MRENTVELQIKSQGNSKTRIARAVDRSQFDILDPSLIFPTSVRSVSLCNKFEFPCEA